MPKRKAEDSGGSDIVTFDPRELGDTSEPEADVVAASANAASSSRPSVDDLIAAKDELKKRVGARSNGITASADNLGRTIISSFRTFLGLTRAAALTASQI